MVLFCTRPALPKTATYKVRDWLMKIVECLAAEALRISSGPSGVVWNENREEQPVNLS